jgi:hypothetical protein
MPALVAGIHFLDPRETKTWMAGTSPATTGRALFPCGRGRPGGSTTRLGEGRADPPSPNLFLTNVPVALSREGRGHMRRRRFTKAYGFFVWCWLGRRHAQGDDLLVHPAKRLIVPSPLVGEGGSAVQRHRLGEGAGRPALTQSFLVNVEAALSRKGRGHDKTRRVIVLRDAPAHADLASAPSIMSTVFCRP